MFKKLIEKLGLGGASSTTDSKNTRLRSGASNPAGKVSEWASMQGLGFSQRTDGRGGYQVDGKIGDKPWRLEQGAPSRDFIEGSELRARAELGVRDDVAVMILSRQLKNTLDKRAFALYTDSLQTIADPHLPEEMRWLSIYEEVGWESLGHPFLNNYAILADNRDNAMLWVSQALADSLTAWPNFDPKSPKILMLLRGKTYLRMQFTDGDQASLEHAAAVFTTACEQALSQLDNKA